MGLYRNYGNHMWALGEVDRTVLEVHGGRVRVRQ